MEEQLAGTGIVADVDMDEQEALLLSYRAARDIPPRVMVHHVLQVEKEAIFAEIDKAAEFYDGKDIVAAPAAAAPRRHDHEADTSADAASTEEE